MFCSECGSNIKSGQKFCTNCGKSKDENNSSDYFNAKVVNSNNYSYKNYTGDLISLIMDVLKKPLSSIGNIEKFNQVMALILAGIFIIANVIAAIINYKNGIYGFITAFNIVDSVGYASVVLSAIITIVVSLGLMTLILWLFAKQKSSDVSYGDAFEIIMYTMIPKILATCVCIIINFIYPQISVKLMLLTTIFAGILLYKLLRYKNLASQDKSVLIVLVAMLFM